MIIENCYLTSPGGKMKSFKVYQSLLILMMLSLILISHCSREDTLLVARVGGRKITLSEFENEFAKSKNVEMLKKATLEEKMKFLEGMVNRQLKIIAAYQQQLDKDEKIIEQVKLNSDRFMFDRLIELEVIQKILPESELKDYYEKANKEIKIRQILVKFESNIPEQKEIAFKRAKRIVERLKQREDFAKLAAENSDDMNTANKGGDKGYLKWGPRSSENPVYVAAFSMKENEISDPIETANSYYIIKVVHVKKYSGPPYEQERERIRRIIYSIRNNEITQAIYDYLDKLRNKYQVQFNDEAIELFVVQYLSPTVNNSDMTKDTLNAPTKNNIPLDNFTENNKKLTVTNFRNSKLTVGDLIEEIKKYPPHQRPGFKNREEVKDFINSRIIPLYLLEQEAKFKNISNDKIVKDRIKSLRENIMINNIQRIQVNDKLEITDDDLLKYFNEHREDYKNPEKREIQQIYVADKKVAENVVRRARRGEDFSKLFLRYNKKEALKKDVGKSEITRGQAGIGNASFKINKGEIADPIQIGKEFSVVKVLNIIEPTLKTFAEAKNNVSSQVRRIFLENREKVWIDELRSRINYAIYEPNVNKSFKRNVPDFEAFE